MLDEAGKAGHGPNMTSMPSDTIETDICIIGAGPCGLFAVFECGMLKMRCVVVDTLENLATVHGERFSLQGEERLQGNWDAQAFRRLLENLCNNAIKYGDPTGRVTVTLKDGGDQAELAVHNGGTPISPEDQTRLFEHFARTKSAEASGKKGWGIGLTLVKGVAEAHGGSGGVSRQPSPLCGRGWLAQQAGRGEAPDQGHVSASLLGHTLTAKCSVVSAVRG